MLDVLMVIPILLFIYLIYGLVYSCINIFCILRHPDGMFGYHPGSSGKFRILDVIFIILTLVAYVFVFMLGIPMWFCLIGNDEVDSVLDKTNAFFCNVLKLRYIPIFFTFLVNIPLFNYEKKNDT